MSCNLKGRLTALMFAFACMALASSTAAQTNNLLGYGSLVRQDQSDCGNNNVDDSDPSSIGGKVTIVQTPAGATTAIVGITSGTPYTSYHFFWKCHYWLGSVPTDENGVGTASFAFQATAGQTFAFDMYPDGAPSGNKFQSVRITPTIAYTGSGSLVRQDQSDCGNSNVNDSDPSRVGGNVTVVQDGSGATAAIAQITDGTPNTYYDFFWKCHFWLGSVQTDEVGAGMAGFVFETAPGQTFAFDMYPNGAPPGNKFQSVPVTLMGIP